MTGIHPFDRDTAVSALGDGRHSCEISDRWLVGRGPNGGYIGAILMRAIQAEVPDRPPRSLTIQYPARPDVGPSVVEVTIERSGRTATFVAARLIQDGTARALAVAVLADQRAGSQDGYVALEMPEVKPVADVHEVPHDTPGLPDIFRNYRFAPALGEPVFSEGEVPRSGGWIRTFEPRSLDAPLVVALMDAWFPVPFVLRKEPFPAPTLDLTVHFRAPLPPAGAAANDWYLCDFSSALARDGFFEEDGNLWSASGHLLAQSRQLALLI